MLRKTVSIRIVALALSLALPASVSAGPLTAAIEKAGREFRLAQAEKSARSRGRLWTSVALIVAGGALVTWGAIELNDSENDTDTDDVPGAPESDKWEKVTLGGGVAAAGVGAILLMTGGRASNPTISSRPGRITVNHTVRF